MLFFLSRNPLIFILLSYIWQRITAKFGEAGTKQCLTEKWPINWFSVICSDQCVMFHVTKSKSHKNKMLVLSFQREIISLLKEMTPAALQPGHPAAFSVLPSFLHTIIRRPSNRQPQTQFHLRNVKDKSQGCFWFMCPLVREAPCRSAVYPEISSVSWALGYRYSFYTRQRPWRLMKGRKARDQIC